VEVVSWRGPVTNYVLLFLEAGTRRVSLAGIMRHPDACCMEPVARHATMQDHRISERLKLPAAQPWREVCREFRDTPRGRWREVHADTRQITGDETTKARTISCCPPLCGGGQVREARSVVESGSAAYSNTATPPH
jgi:hypothetical protein